MSESLLLVPNFSLSEESLLEEKIKISSILRNHELLLKLYQEFPERVKLMNNRISDLLELEDISKMRAKRILEIEEKQIEISLQIKKLKSLFLQELIFEFETNEFQYLISQIEKLIRKTYTNKSNDERILAERISLLDQKISQLKSSYAIFCSSLSLIDG